MTDWTGDERRNSGEDHDLLIRIDANLDNFIQRFDAHEKENGRDFKTVFKRTGANQKILWLILGGIIFLNFILPRIEGTFWG